MTVLLRLAMVGLAGACLALGLFVGTGPSLGQVFDHLANETERGEALDASSRLVRDSVADKQVITNELIAGRINLADAADRFQRWQAKLDESPGCVRMAPSRSEIYRIILVWVSIGLKGAPAKQAVLDRLGRERARLEGAASARTEAPGG